MSFEEYCQSKKIDPQLFKNKEPERFEEWKQIFNTVSINSFTQQKLFLINETRRKYKLTEKISNINADEAVPVNTTTKASFKPKFK